MNRGAIKAGKAEVYIGANVKELERGLKKAHALLKGFGSSMKKFGAVSMGLGAGIAAALKPAVDAARKWEDAQFRAQKIFGKNASKQIMWAKQTGKELGRSRRDILNFTTSVAFMYESIGIKGEKAVEVAQNLAKVSILFANIQGTTAQEMQQRFIRALSGSAEVLDQFGVILKESALKGEMVRLGFDSSEQTEAAKALARYNLLLKDTMKAMDAKDPATFTDAIQRLNAEWQIFLEDTGMPLLKELSKLIDGLTAVLAKISKMHAGDLGELGKQIALAAAGLVALGAIFVGLGTAVSVSSTAFFAFSKGVIATERATSKLWIAGAAGLKNIKQFPAAYKEMGKAASRSMEKIAGAYKLGGSHRVRLEGMVRQPQIQPRESMAKHGRGIKNRILFHPKAAKYGTARPMTGKGAAPITQWQRSVASQRRYPDFFGAPTEGRGRMPQKRVTTTLTARQSSARTSQSIRTSGTGGQKIMSGAREFGAQVGGSKNALKGLKATDTALKTTLRTVGKVAKPLMILTTAWDLVGRTSKAALDGITSGVNTAIPSLLQIPDLVQLWSVDPAAAGEGFKQIWKLIENEAYFTFAKIGDAIKESLLGALKEVLDYSLFLFPTMFNMINSLFGGADDWWSTADDAAKAITGVEFDKMGSMSQDEKLAYQRKSMEAAAGVSGIVGTGREGFAAKEAETQAWNTKMQDASAKLMTNLAERAEKGDKVAIEQLKGIANSNQMSRLSKMDIATKKAKKAIETQEEKEFFEKLENKFGKAFAEAQTHEETPMEAAQADFDRAMEKRKDWQAERVDLKKELAEVKKAKPDMTSVFSALSSRSLVGKVKSRDGLQKEIRDYNKSTAEATEAIQRHLEQKSAAYAF